MHLQGNSLNNSDEFYVLCLFFRAVPTPDSMLHVTFSSHNPNSRCLRWAVHRGSDAEVLKHTLFRLFMCCQLNHHRSSGFLNKLNNDHNTQPPTLHRPLTVHQQQPTSTQHSVNQDTDPDPDRRSPGQLPSWPIPWMAGDLISTTAERIVAAGARVRYLPRVHFNSAVTHTECRCFRQGTWKWHLYWSGVQRRVCRWGIN